MKLYDDTCPGPINKRGGFTKILRIRPHESIDIRRKHTAQGKFDFLFIRSFAESDLFSAEKEKKQMEADSGVDINESGKFSSGSAKIRFNFNGVADCLFTRGLEMCKQQAWVCIYFQMSCYC